MNEKNNHHTVIVQKPWGYEYIAYQNKDVALKILHISHNERTSMHCHPDKTTGLIVVGGQARLNFIADHYIVTAPGKKMIRRGLFHQTQAISENGVVMLEVETPVDKDDLVRLKDNYGRTDSGYEGSEHEMPKTEECIWIENPSTSPVEYKISDCIAVVERISDIDVLLSKDKDNIIMFLQGGLVKTVNDRQHLVTKPGDVGTVDVVSQVAVEMDGFAEDSIILTIKQ